MRLWPLLCAVLAGCAEAPGRLGQPYVESLGRWYWGDPHAHSAWSYDGCEEPDAGCAAHAGGPGAGFLQVAHEQGLDFVALTDHAEADLYWPQGLGGQGFSVWQGQQATLQEGLDGGVAILGYEWTGFRGTELGGRPRGGHRTVLLGAIDACESYRVGGHMFEDGVSVPEQGTAVFQQVRTHQVADTVAQLWTLLDQAGELCEPVRWLSYGHHSAYPVPQETDWVLDENAPQREAAIEVYSEHGSSECADPTAAGCSWGVPDDVAYYADGSVQVALDQGFQLGFVGGTDSHNSRPGSLDDGPSPVAAWLDTDGDGVGDAVRVHRTPGGLTGVLIDGDLTTDTIFDAIEARHTMASSGPRPQIGVMGLGANGVEYLPGEVVPPEALPLVVRAWVVAEPGTRVVIERIQSTGSGPELAESMAGPGFDGRWTPRRRGWTYLRVRYLYEDDVDTDAGRDTGMGRDADATSLHHGGVGRLGVRGTTWGGAWQGEDRVWISPWFVEASPPSGCATVGRRGSSRLGWWWLWGVAVAARRRLGRGRGPSHALTR